MLHEVASKRRFATLLCITCLAAACGPAAGSTTPIVELPPVGSRQSAVGSLSSRQSGSRQSSRPSAVSEVASPRTALTASETKRTRDAGSAALGWEPDEAAAVARARRERRPLLVFVRADWSAASLTVDRDVFGDPRVVAAARDFVAVRVDVTLADVDAEAASQRHGGAVPAARIVDGDGRQIAMVSGPFTAEELLAAIERAR